MTDKREDAMSMVEAVARALALEDACDPDFVDENARVQWTYHIGAARAAIQAMRRPTDEVGDALDCVPGGWGRGAWQAGIDAALEPASTGGE